jgi:hypothetical protein
VIGGGSLWKDGAMVEAIEWTIIGLFGLVGGIIGICAAFQMGKTGYRGHQ